MFKAAPMILERAKELLLKDGLDQAFEDAPIGIQNIYLNRAQAAEKTIKPQKGLGVNMVGGKTIKSKREGLDFYPTHPDAVYSLIQYLNEHYPKVIEHAAVWEPCCGNGAMSKVLSEKTSSIIISTDTKDYGYEGFNGIVDCLENKPDMTPWLDLHVITNPPFNIADKIIRKLAPEHRFVALLLKSTYFHAEKRIDLFEKFPPSLILPLTWRLDWTGDGNPTMECSWFIWDKLHYTPFTKYDLLKRHRYTAPEEAETKDAAS